VVGSLFSTVLDRAEQAGVRKKAAGQCFLIGWGVMAGKPKSAKSEPENNLQYKVHM
jgi:hypothetical protein